MYSTYMRVAGITSMIRLCTNTTSMLKGIESTFANARSKQCLFNTFSNQPYPFMLMLINLLLVSLSFYLLSSILIISNVLFVKDFAKINPSFYSNPQRNTSTSTGHPDPDPNPRADREEDKVMENTKTQIGR